ncbi:hypothetical protein BX600DRAFT_509582 [Xylariales sp. PMI_506]|nr:hypothetical protein BX600DRAFT_509582 [Xylariales sp. PMI_506]
MASPPPPLGSVPAFPLTQPLEDDDSEWEYEYSTTETETYYVTLDISKADFVTKQQASVPNGRGGYKEKQLGDIHAKNHDDDDETLMQARGTAQEDEDDEVQDRDTSSQAKSSRVPDDSGSNEVQILELHSANPIISYRGRIYEGQWSQNLGTELLMTKRDDSNPLPAIRHLEQDIDLLAASSARIMLTEKTLKSNDADVQKRHRKVRFDEEDMDISDGDENPLVPDPEPGASRERYEQGDFLSKLIALKKRKGETDEVTVIARVHEDTRRQPANPDRARARGKTRGAGRGGGARTRQRRASSRASGASAPGRIGTVEASHGSGSDLAPVAGERGSRPTPHKWSDMKDPATNKEAESHITDNSEHLESGGGHGAGIEDMDID